MDFCTNFVQLYPVEHFPFSRVVAMIDRLVLRCHIRDPEFFRLEGLSVPLIGSIDTDGEVYALRHVWESIPSSFSNMAFKIFDYSDQRANPLPYIELNASPAKLMQGHNVYGSDDLIDCSFALLELFYSVYPQVALLLDISSWTVVEVDITYASWASSAREARQFINSLCNVSNGQTRARHGYDGTAYFGKKNSRLKKLKVYDKLHEVLNYLAGKKGSKDDPAKFFPPELMAWIEGMIRWEVTLKSRWFERRGISNNLFELRKVFDPQAYWLEATKDIFESLEGHTMKIVNDEEVLNQLKARFPTVNVKTGKVSYGLANSAYRTYRSIKADGWLHVFGLMGRSNFYKHVDMITACGLSRAYLQNLQGDGCKCEVIPMVRFAVVEFRNQFPDFYRKAA